MQGNQTKRKVSLIELIFNKYEFTSSHTNEDEFTFHTHITSLYVRIYTYI